MNYEYEWDDVAYFELRKVEEGEEAYTEAVRFVQDFDIESLGGELE